MENKKSLIFLLFAELICFAIIKINLISYTNPIYSTGTSIVQFLYFLPIFISSLYIFFCRDSNRKKLTFTTLALVLYSLILHFFMKEIASFFTSTQGIINFVEYASKIYFICLPFISFRIFAIQKENTKSIYFLMLLRIIFLLVITIIFKKLFELKGVLYAWPFSELIAFVWALQKSVKFCR